jgi:VWFA-related protein
MERHPYCIGMRTLVVFAFGALLMAQTPQKPTPAKAEDENLPAIKVEVNLVNILASVRDKRGALVSTLGKDDFTVLDDGKPQEIKYFTRETDLPLTIGLLIDVSRSQENLINVEQNAASEFFSQVLRKKDEAFLISFGEESELLQDYTSSARALSDSMRGLRVSSAVGPPVIGGISQPGPVPTISQPRGTVLYDAVYLAANEKLKSEVGRKVIVVITDGVDEGSKVKIEEAIEAAQKADTVIYSIDYQDRGFYGPFGGGGFGGSALSKMSEETGGRVYRVDGKHPLQEIFKELQDEMRSQYSIAYTATNGVRDGSYHKLDIRTKDKNLKVQARKGYYAMPGEGQ